MPLRPRRLVAGLLLPALVAASALAGGLSDDRWDEARKQASRLMKLPGQRPAKQKVVDDLAEDDSRRAAELLVQWARRSAKLQQGALARDLAETKEDFEKVDRQLRRFYEKMPPTRKEDKDNWDRVRLKYEAALQLYEIEDGVRYSIGQGLRALRSEEAVRYLLEDGLPTVQKVRGTESIQVAIARGLLEQPRERVLPTALAFAREGRHAKLRVLGLNWIGQHQVAEGFDALVEALRAPEELVRRAAVPALKALDDPRAVRPLIAALEDAAGQLAAEIDDVLHHFTGQDFEASAAVWRQWWEREGEAWLTAGGTGRFQRRREELPGGTKVRFYGIPTESHHVVFVLDRSGSMKEPAGEEARERTKDRPRGPVTGDGGDGKGKDGKEDEPLAGDTKIDVAKNQLARSIDQLDKDVRFNVVFYSTDVQVWREPPDLLDSTPDNREAAKAWFLALEAEGSTQLFAALTKALAYADPAGADPKRPRPGADTIFLLSDGSPTSPDGQVLPREVLEEQLRLFLEANKLYHCVVHCIGVGPGHNRSLMERLARETGGKYRGVGVR